MPFTLTSKWKWTRKILFVPQLSLKNEKLIIPRRIGPCPALSSCSSYFDCFRFCRVQRAISWRMRVLSIQFHLRRFYQLRLQKSKEFQWKRRLVLMKRERVIFPWPSAFHPCSSPLQTSAASTQCINTLCLGMSSYILVTPCQPTCSTCTSFEPHFIKTRW